MLVKLHPAGIEISKPAAWATFNFSVTSVRISSRYAEKSKNAASDADLHGIALGQRLGSYFPPSPACRCGSRTESGWLDISIMPPALSVIGPKVSHRQDVRRATQHAHGGDRLCP